MATVERRELLHERALAERIAGVRLILSLANIGVLVLDHTVPLPGTIEAYSEAAAVAVVFCAYAFWIRKALRARRLDLTTYTWVSPILDVALAALLIAFTNGYLSPFNLWLVFAVVSSGFTRRGRMIVVTAALAATAHCLIALIPQAEPLDPSVFAVRSGYLFGFAAVLSAVGYHLTAQSRVLADLEEASRQLGEAMSRDEVVAVLSAQLKDSLRCESVRFVDGGERGDQTAFEIETPGRRTVLGHPAAEFGLVAGHEKVGEIQVCRRAPLTETERAFVHVLCDRAASAMVRIRATQRLAEAAAATERLRLADELHDSCLQTLAAVDMRIEAVRQMTAGPAEPLVGELDALKEVVRHAGSQIRASFQMHGVILDPGPSVVRRIVEERWPSPAEVEIDPTVELSTEQWRALEMFVKEGINNALRHGGGAHLALRLTRARAGSVQCLLRNDGRLLAGTPPFGYGLNRLREQVEAVGGRLAFESDPQGGATLSVMFSRDP